MLLPTGEIEVLLTNLYDTVQWPLEQFGELYQLRWPVEEGYKFDKSRLEIERWSTAMRCYSPKLRSQHSSPRSSTTTTHSSVLFAR